MPRQRNMLTRLRNFERSVTGLEGKRKQREKQTQNIVRGLILGFLLSLLTNTTGCTNRPTQLITVETINVPQALLRDCEVPKPPLAYDSTNAEYEEWVDDLYTALVECAASKRELREYFAAIRKKDVDKTGTER